MTLTVANVDITTDTWQGLINKLNYVIEGVNVNFVTVGGNASVGNVAIHGVLTVNTANIASLSSNAATITTLTANTANTARLISTVLVSNTFTSNSANVTTLTANVANISTANVANATVTGTLSSTGSFKVSGTTPSVEILTNDVTAHDYRIYSTSANTISIAVDRTSDGTFEAAVFTLDTAANTITAFGSRVWTDADNGDTDSPNAETLGGNEPAFYQNANNINAGTLSDARLPTTMAGKTFSTPITIDSTTSQMLILRPAANTGLAYMRWQLEDETPLGYLGMDNANGNLTFRRNTVGNIDIHATTGGSISMTSTTLTHNGNDVWTEANFDPATKADLSGAVFTASVAVRANTTTGYSRLDSGSTTSPGYVSFYTEGGLRAGFVGSETGTTLRLYSDSAQGYTGWTAQGTFTATGDITAFSDARLKTNVETIDNALSMVEEMRGVRFTKDGKRGIGVIAQEMQIVAPELVTEADDEDKTLSVAYGNALGIMIEAIKELKAEVDSLKAQLEAK